MTTSLCADPSENLATPMKLILRDDAGNDVDTLDIHGIEFGGQGVTLLEGYENFHHPDFTLPRESGAYQMGSTPGIPRINERLPTFILGTQAATAAQLEAVETRLWKFLSIFHECVLQYHSHLSEPREIRIRLERKPKDQLKQGPGLRRFGVWEIISLACDPAWVSQEIKFAIKRSEMTNVGGGVYEATFPMQNPADFGCYPIFASNSLETTTTVTLPDRDTGRVVKLPALTTGREFLCRTDPMLRTLLVRDNTLAPWVAMNARAFDDDPIEPGLVDPVNVPVRIEGGTANTTVTLYLAQRWQRCAGGEV
ncbi:hypothetical protein GCM10007304_17560 [Rhodococcoides trifolii]|uniref:Uncharacterized protein n=1 Tax=Rhodococcoides trifolii TaxID=908250 RepID=A0A917D0H8_9NOCA|nr:hypothetical protein [Rhodococcus trifolii]GGG03892.1 hypothetical protein GCM10007304_17560 [Rhodococcus trifolii]